MRAPVTEHVKMNAVTEIVAPEAEIAGRYSDLVKDGFEGLAPLLSRSAEVRAALEDIAKIGDKTTARKAAALKQKLLSLEPSVTMIGQVKAGKTSLVNAMVGWPELLPADVNPWTSVVTSLHLDPCAKASDNRASFTFFDRTEWDRLVLNGGRMGELAGRAGADDEVEKVRRQIADMQEKSRARLGRKFELLLGQTHDYGYFDSQLVERYVCLGDDFEEDTNTSQTQGRFADITKSADIFMQRPELPLGLCIRDTPGVNDTFMMREQITIRSIRDSRICVVVLSAHQALSSVDMALIRLIANVKSREVVIFVNRIDELSDPARQVAEIRDSIRATLRAHHGPEDAQIIFGSAFWSNSALGMSLDGMPKDSADALLNWAEEALKGRSCPETNEAIIWELSGVPALYRALSERIEEGVGREMVDAVARSARSLASSLQASTNMLSLRSSGAPRQQIDVKSVEMDFQGIGQAGQQALKSEFEKLISDFGTRVDRSHQSFLERATASLIEHLEVYGESTVWKYDPTGLRVLLRSAYQLFSKRTQDSARKVLDAMAGDITGLYWKYGLTDDPEFRIEPPRPPRTPSPVLLGQTIALDLQANWWSRWWRRRRGYDAFAQEFAELIRAETDPITSGLKRDHAVSIREAVNTVLTDFLKEQYSILANIAEQGDMDDDDLAAIFGVSCQKDRAAVLSNVTESLNKFAA